MYKWCNENLAVQSCFIWVILKSQVLLTMWYNITGEAAGEIWTWSLGLRGYEPRQCEWLCEMLLGTLRCESQSQFVMSLNFQLSFLLFISILFPLFCLFVQSTTAQDVWWSTLSDWRKRLLHGQGHSRYASMGVLGGEGVGVRADCICLFRGGGGELRKRLLYGQGHLWYTSMGVWGWGRVGVRVECICLFRGGSWRVKKKPKALSETFAVCIQWRGGGAVW